MKTKKTARWFYREFLFVGFDYWATATISEKLFDVIWPILGAAIALIVYIWKPIAFADAQQLVAMLTTTLSILIGFTVTSVTILATSGNPNVEALKKEKTKRTLGGTPISLFKAANISLYFVLLSELFTLGFAALLMFFPGVLSKFQPYMCAICFGLFAHVLLTNVRCMTSLYFIFWDENRNTPAES